MSKHTPGPWKYTIKESGTAEIRCDKKYTIPYSNGGIPTLATLWNFGRIGNEFGNAVLIAAAPDLLAACESALLRDDIANSELGDQIRAAVAKAKGESL